MVKERKNIGSVQSFVSVYWKFSMQNYIFNLSNKCLVFDLKANIAHLAENLPVFFFVQLPQAPARKAEITEMVLKGFFSNPRNSFLFMNLHTNLDTTHHLREIIFEEYRVVVNKNLNYYN